MPTCPKCGTESDEKICPKCGTKLKTKFPISLFFIIIILIVILFACIFISPYKHIDIHEVSNPTIGEKVQFDSKYIGITSVESDEDLLYYMPPPRYDVLQYGSQYVFLTGDYNDHGLYGNEGKKVHLEGEFEDSIMTSQSIKNKNVEGYFFNADKIELI